MTELYPRLVLRRALFAAGLVAGVALALLALVERDAAAPMQVITAETTTVEPVADPPSPVVDDAAEHVFPSETRTLRSRARKAPPPSGPVGRVFASHRAALERCYANARAKDPGASGRISLRWRINADGSVAHLRILEAAISDKAEVGRELGECITRRVTGFRFAGLAPAEGAWATHHLVMRPRHVSRQLRLQVTGWEHLVGDAGDLEPLALQIEAALPAIADCYAAARKPRDATDGLIVGWSRSQERQLLGVTTGSTLAPGCAVEELFPADEAQRNDDLVGVARLTLSVRINKPHGGVTS